MEEIIAPILIVLFILFTVLISKYGMAGLGFWGKKRTKIAEFSSKTGKWVERTIIYSLEGKNGYQGYGIDFSNTKTRKGISGFEMKISASSIEFTKDEADQLVTMLKPLLK